VDKTKKALADGRKGLDAAVKSVDSLMGQVDSRHICPERAERELRGNRTVARDYAKLKTALRNAAKELAAAKSALDGLDRAVGDAG
jgi:hypothetical protein